MTRKQIHHIDSTKFYYLLTVVFISMFFWNCQPSNFPASYEKTDVPVSNYNLVAPFHDLREGFVYDLHIYVKKEHISGLLVFKKAGELYRFSLLTKTGQKLLDLSTDGDELIVHSAIESLNKKVILQELKKNFALLLLSCKNVQSGNVYESESAAYIQVKDCNEEFNRLLFGIDKSTSHTTYLGTSHRLNKKRWATFSDFENGIPIQMTIELRSLINLRMEFTKIDLHD